MSTHKRRSQRSVTGRQAFTACLLSWGFLTAGCGSTAQVATEYNPHTNFSRFQTYSWRKGVGGGGNESLDRRIRKAVNRELQKKGLQEVDKGGDLNVAFYVTLETKLDSYAWDYLNGPYWSYWNRGVYGPTELTAVPEGKVVVDLIDRERNQLVWRGVSIDQLVRDEDDLEGHISYVTAEMFEAFPPDK